MVSPAGGSIPASTIACSAALDSPWYLSASSSFFEPTFIPIASETTTKANQPKMAALRCSVLQRPMRAAMPLACITPPPVVVVVCMGPDSRAGGAGPMRLAGVLEVRFAASMVRLPVWPNHGAAARLDAMKVLIVDDHAGFRASARRMLEADGFEVVAEAGSGAEALQAAEAWRPELVLLDVHL